MEKLLPHHIEKLREQLAELAKTRGFHDAEVLRISQSLDRLIVDYLSHANTRKLA